MQKLIRLMRNPISWAVVLIVVGFVVALIYGSRTVRSYRQLQYATEQGLLDGSASIDAIQPWMTARYVAVAYAVPEEFLFAALDIPFDRRNSNDPLGRLDHGFGDGPPADGEPPAILTAVGEAIQSYREHPVATGLRDIRPWMSLQYIANSTGVPVAYLFGQIGVSATDNAYKPLDLLAAEQHFEGGPRRLVDALRDALESYEAQRVTVAEISSQVFTWLVTYGSPVLAVALFVGALGLPLPGTLFVLAAGAFVRQGVLDPISLLPLALVGVVMGDLVSFGLGRLARTSIENQSQRWPSLEKASDYFRQRGGVAVYLTRWLITPLAIPVNLAAGSSGYPLGRFLVFDLAGEMTWLLLMGGAGYAVGSSWEVIGDFVGDFSGLLLGIGLLGFGLYIAFRWWRRPAVVEQGPQIATAEANAGK
ncbi:MAG: DedA family protein [Caldilineaceae bacterium]|nr:DedA family protein [Caldilineaceae bacterium]